MSLWSWVIIRDMNSFIKCLITLSLILLSTGLYAADANSNKGNYVWGKIVHTKKLSHSGFEYYVLYSDKGSQIAYPIIPTASVPATKIDQYLNQMARISGEIKTKKFYDGEFQKDIITFEVQGIEPLKLSDLGISKNRLNLTKKYTPPSSSPKSNSGGITINDTVADALILAGGAAILGSIIYDITKGK